MDDATAAVQVANATNEKPVGLLLNDVVNLDLTRQHINYAKDEVQKGSKVLLLRRGTVVTDQISGTPTIGADAYVTRVGTISATAIEGVMTVFDGTIPRPITPKVGRFLSTLDADGFAKVEINIT